MTTAKKSSKEQPLRGFRPMNVAKTRELFRRWRETAEKGDDLSEWETLKRLLDEDRPADSKLFPNEYI